jgi:protein SCO1/2
MKHLLRIGFAFMLLVASAAWAQLPPELFKQIGFEQRLNQPLPLQLTFHDERGRAVRLGDYFRDGRPVIVFLGYYDCPNLCGTALAGLVAGLRGIPFNAGQQYEVVVASINPSETPAQAAMKKQVYVDGYGRPHTAQGWHFLTGTAPAIAALTQAVGFRYRYDADIQQYAHPSGIVVATGEGVISRYLLGIEFPPRDLRLGLVEAAGNRIGSPADQLLLLCYHYNPLSGTYDFWVLRALRLAGIASVFGLAFFVGLMLLRDHRRARERA